MVQKIISMTEKELSRYDIIMDLINQNINGTDASKMTGLSVRQTKRLKIKVINYGLEGLIHGNRNRISNREMSDKKKDRIKELLKEKYYDFNPTLASEKLTEDEKIKTNKETIRQLMIKMDLWKPKPRKSVKNKHYWRPRKDNYGEMQQFDGSYHIWFGEEESCLLLSVDDATGKITHAKFDYNESIIAVFDFWWEYFELNGTPISIYLDKFSTYKVNHKNATDNKGMITQFERAMHTAGVRTITAHSPEAKGRVERMFKTLQNRLVKELRLAGVKTMEEANDFLITYIPKFNAKFGVIPARRKNLHKEVNKMFKDNLTQIFSVQEERKVNNDYTILFKKKTFLLNDTQTITVYKRDIVIVEIHLNGSIKINLKGHYLNYIEIPERPKKIINVKLPALTNRKPSSWKPPADHPWRKYSLSLKKRISIEQLITDNQKYSDN